MCAFSLRFLATCRKLTDQHNTHAQESHCSLVYRWKHGIFSGIHAGICCGEDAGQLVEGQSFLCMSLSVGTVNQVARQLMIPSLFFYDWVLPVWSSEIYPALRPLLSTGAP